MGDDRMINALSFDIEDWFHLVEIEAVADPARWDSLSSIVVEYTRWIVETIDKAGVRATFFILGWVADKHPELAKMIAASGHEIATHSYWHRKVYDLTPDEFREDMQRSIEVLSNQTGQKIRGFRAPSFSITPGTEWAFDVLHDLGIDYVEKRNSLIEAVTLDDVKRAAARILETNNLITTVVGQPKNLKGRI